jgi:hypothetical protein
MFQEAIDHCRWTGVLSKVLEDVNISLYRNSSFGEILTDVNSRHRVKGAVGLLTVYDITAAICRHYGITIDKVYIIGNGPKKAVKLWIETPFSGEERHIRRIKKIDEMRISNNTFDASNDKIYEYILLEIIDNLVGFYVDKKANWYYYYYTLHFMRKNEIENLNKYVIEFVDHVLKQYETSFNIKTFIKYSQRFVEKNEYLLKYQDCGLYEHQKQIFTKCKNATPKLILYIAPTGTGKTLTPIGLSEPHNIPNPDKKVGGVITKKNRIIFSL